MVTSETIKNLSASDFDWVWERANGHEGRRNIGNHTKQTKIYGRQDRMVAFLKEVETLTGK
jgi:hypothetical protein